MIAASSLMASHAGAQTLNLHEAATIGDGAAVESWIKAGVPLDEADGAGRTALLVAVDNGRTDIALALIAAGADINAQAANKDTPWLLAGASGRTEILAAMIPKGPNLSIRNRYGGNALIPACERGHVDTVKLLLTTKIDADHVNDLGWTCLLEIAYLSDGSPRHLEIARLVLQAGADPDVPDIRGKTALDHAETRKLPALAALLKAHKARLN